MFLDGASRGFSTKWNVFLAQYAICPFGVGGSWMQRRSSVCLMLALTPWRVYPFEWLLVLGSRGIPRRHHDGIGILCRDRCDGMTGSEFGMCSSCLCMLSLPSGDDIIPQDEGNVFCHVDNWPTCPRLNERLKGVQEAQNRDQRWFVLKRIDMWYRRKCACIAIIIAFYKCQMQSDNYTKGEVLPNATLWKWKWQEITVRKTEREQMHQNANRKMPHWNVYGVLLIYACIV